MKPQSARRNRRHDHHHFIMAELRPRLWPWKPILGTTSAVEVEVKTEKKVPDTVEGEAPVRRFVLCVGRRAISQVRKKERKKAVERKKKTRIGRQSQHKTIRPKVILVAFSNVLQ